MQSSSPITEPQGNSSEKPYDLDLEIPAASGPSVSSESREFVMGPRQMASLAFVAVVVLGIMSAVAYFAGRKNTEAPKVTERVIERVVQAPVAAQVVVKPVDPPRPPPVIETKMKAEVTAPVFNRVYLQAGSVEVGIAQVMVEGLRQRGVPAIVGIGINSRVARVLVGPFNSEEEQRIAQKKIESLDFHPFPRIFTEKDLEQQQITPMNPPVQQPLAPPPLKP